MSRSLFPKNFFWGASTASHQVEGNTRNQWSVWERNVAAEQIKTAQNRLGWLPIWQEIQHEAQDPENYISGAGVEHYTRYKDDFKLLKKLNLNAFRFGIEWSRIEPEEGKWDQAALEHYHHYIQELRALDIEPFLNIWHWTEPVWFSEKGSFKYKKNLVYFDRLVRKLAEEYGSDVQYVLTLNEPNVYASFSYLTGTWPPQDRSVRNFLRVYWNLTRAHRRAYSIWKSLYPSAQVGIAQQVANIQAKRPHHPIDQSSTRVMRYWWNWWFFNRIRRHQDFVGFNYYFTDYYKGRKRINPSAPLNDLGWYMEPEGLYPILLRIWSYYKKPVFITENGVADRHDQYRQWWLQETLVAMERAVSEGVDLRGYFHWSLLDNFEWATGWWPKFGLVEVDREHDMKRTIRPSAKWFAEAIKHFQESNN